jgi:hypothetical protein
VSSLWGEEAAYYNEAPHRDLPMTGRSFGYARVSTDDQDLTLQIDALTKHEISESNIFTDKLCGARSDRPGLTQCLDSLQPADILVVWRLDRLGRSMRHLITLVEDLRSRGIGFRSLNESVCMHTVPPHFVMRGCRISCLPDKSTSTVIAATETLLTFKRQMLP